jgi:hypothetical protein
MARAIAATPMVRGKDAKRIFGVMRVEKEVDKNAVDRRTTELFEVRTMFKKVQPKRG